MHRYRIDIAYDGTSFGGWQIQPNAVTIQELIQNALKVILRHDIAVVGSGRTDAGVHAFRQTAHFDTPSPVDPFRLCGSLNGVLPPEIRIMDLRPVPSEFHARYSAVGKVYHYELYTGLALPPFKRLYCWHVRRKIDLKLLKEAARLFVGTHDFTSFANEAYAGSAAKDPVRTLFRLDVVEEGDAITLQFEGDGFLYKMVRNITGALVECAAGKLPLSEIPKIFQGKDRKLAPAAAPPQGLFLMKVDYSL